MKTFKVTEYSGPKSTLKFSVVSVNSKTAEVIVECACAKEDTANKIAELLRINDAENYGRILKSILSKEIPLCRL